MCGLKQGHFLCNGKSKRAAPHLLEAGNLFPLGVPQALLLGMLTVLPTRHESQILLIQWPILACMGTQTVTVLNDIDSSCTRPVIARMPADLTFTSSSHAEPSLCQFGNFAVWQVGLRHCRHLASCFSTYFEIPPPSSPCSLPGRQPGSCHAPHCHPPQWAPWSSSTPPTADQTAGVQRGLENSSDSTIHLPSHQRTSKGVASGGSTERLRSPCLKGVTGECYIKLGTFQLRE